MFCTVPNAAWLPHPRMHARSQKPRRGKKTKRNNILLYSYICVMIYRNMFSVEVAGPLPQSHHSNFPIAWNMVTLFLFWGEPNLKLNWRPNLKFNFTIFVFSEQQLVDCDYNNGGCGGGWYTSAWDYLKNDGGCARDDLYQYVATVSLSRLCDCWLSQFQTAQIFCCWIFSKILAGSVLECREPR